MKMPTMCGCIGKLYTCDTHNTIGISVKKKGGFLPLRIDRETIKELNDLVRKHGYRSRSELIREAIGDKLAQLKGMEIVRIRNISKKQAKEEILKYIRGKDRVYASDVAHDLRLDLQLVFDLIEELFQEEKVEGVK